MSGIRPYQEIVEIARSLPELQTRAELVTALDRVEYLFEVIPPELQDPVEQLIAQLRHRLQQAD
jgi:type III secretion system FlhB-like substrate exporter